MNSKIQKTKGYFKENGAKETLKKAYRYVSFKLKVKRKTKFNTVYIPSKRENRLLNLKTINKVFIFANMPYIDETQKISQIAKTFNSMGYLVKYFYAFNNKEQGKNNVLLPLAEHKKIDKINIEKFRQGIKNNDIFIFETKKAEFEPFIEIATSKGCTIIYEDVKDIKDYYKYSAQIIDKICKNDKCDKEFYENISIVILNYNNKNVIENCINSILEFNERYKIEIIVVDNQSTDGSYELLQEKYKEKIKLYRNSKNGCSSGRNLGVKNATKKYIMFLDSDQWVLHKYWLEPYIEILSQDKNIGGLGWAARLV